MKSTPATAKPELTAPDTVHSTVTAKRGLAAERQHTAAPLLKFLTVSKKDGLSFSSTHATNILLARWKNIRTRIDADAVP
jgi:hypothetical protein